MCMPRSLSMNVAMFCTVRSGIPCAHEPESPAASLRESGTVPAGIASAPVLREWLLGLLRPDVSRIVIDLSGVAFCDASGLAVLVGASRRAGLLGLLVSSARGRRVPRDRRSGRPRQIMTKVELRLVP